MEQKTNKLAQFKQWIFSIVICRNMITSKRIGVTLIRNRFNLNYLWVGFFNRFGFDIQHKKIHLFDGKKQHNYCVIGFILIYYGNMERYYAKADQYGNCYEPCQLKKDKGTMIGSCSCSECHNCIKHGKDAYGGVTWIECRNLDGALGRNVELNKLQP